MADYSQWNEQRAKALRLLAELPEMEDREYTEVELSDLRQKLFDCETCLTAAHNTITDTSYIWDQEQVG